ncbi:general substrate transporter [Wolfiporia cocos MD-104 SS10]|uniref:General substrate transporter n=1 Tax=Wolfiporia cocos (strain MD-104) TaxID=742152 RepID=A0A2H3JLZ7_WOLCO|nr:general substrate transporter [Wolfiporia cocos MD-104 SS10]
MAPMSGRRLYVTINLVAGLAIFFFGYDQGMMGGLCIRDRATLRWRVNHLSGRGQYISRLCPHHEVGIFDVRRSFRRLCCDNYGAYQTRGSRQHLLPRCVGRKSHGRCHGGSVSTMRDQLALTIENMSHRIGRIKTMMWGSVWVLLGATLQCSAQNITWMCCARVINGIGTGHLNAIVPVWSAEVATHTSRGAFIASEFTLNIFAVVVAYWIEFGLSFIGDGSSPVRWRLPVALQIIPVLALMTFLPHMPESPRWLIKMGRIEEARVLLSRFRTEDGNLEDARVVAEFEEILAAAELEKQHAAATSYVAMFFGLHDGKLHVARRVQLSIWLQIFQEWSGIAAIIFYAPTIFSGAGYGARKSQWLSGLNYVTYTTCTLLGIVSIDRVGRRIGLWWGAVGQGTSLILAGAFIRLLKDHPDMARRYGGAAALCVFLYTAIFGATWLAIPWVYQTETFPLYVRAKGNAWGVVGWSIGNGWLTLLNPVMFARIAENTLHVFGAVNFLTIPIVWAFYPETANRTLEEMDHLFMSDSPFVWDEEAHFQQWKRQEVERTVDSALVRAGSTNDPKSEKMERDI